MSASPVLLAAEAGHGSLSVPILPILVFIPVLGAVLITLVPRTRPEMHRLIAATSAALTGLVAFYVLWIFKVGDPGYQFVSEVTWIASLDIRFALGIDGISLFLVVLTGLIFPIAVFAAKPEHSEKGYYFWLTVLMAGCMGVFLALDLMLFFLFFEITLVPLYMLIGKWGHGRKVYAATKFFLYTMAGSMLMLVAIVGTAYFSKAGDGGTISFDLRKVVEVASAPGGGLTQNVARVLFLGFAIAFAVKTPIFPFHTWLPDAHTEAPTAGSIDLAGILLKLGTYGFIRYGLFLFPEASVWFAPVMITLGTIGIVYGAVVAAMQKNLKRLVAYSSVSHMGFCIIGLFALNIEGMQGAILQMVNHGIITGGLFILLGFLYQRRHTYEMSELRGIQRAAPMFAGLFTFVMLASIGLPGLSGFVGEFLSLLGTFMAYRWWAVVAATGAILSSLYLLWAYQRTFHGMPDEKNSRFPDLRPHEWAVMAPIVALIVFLGVYPKPVLERIEPSVEKVLCHVQDEVPGWEYPGAQNGDQLVAPEAGGHAAEGAAAGDAEAEGHGTEAGHAAEAAEAAVEQAHAVDEARGEPSRLHCGEIDAARVVDAAEEHAAQGEHP
jgi:NADH-quinone oxidoreductase subunit M